MAVEQAGPRRRVQPMECASAHYVCEQIEDTIERGRRALGWYEEQLTESKAELQERSKADYLGSTKESMMESARESISRYEHWIIEAKTDVDRLLELLREAKSLEEHILAFWEEKDKRQYERR